MPAKKWESNVDDGRLCMEIFVSTLITVQVVQKHVTFLRGDLLLRIHICEWLRS